jgi:L-threonylcarbamoyladenylate synthase
MHQTTLEQQINQAVEYLQQGKLVAFPTETVYGLGACVNNPDAILRVFATKQRPTNHPLIVHIAGIEQLSQVAINIPAYAYILAKHFWPGELTLILDKHPSIPDLVTAGQTTVGIRVPQHPITLQLLKRLNVPIVGPSANSFGKVSPTSYFHVQQDLGDKVDFILDGGQCAVGIESTILSLANSEQPTVFRPGKITADQISTVLNKSVNIQLSATPGTQVSGQLDAHYQPNKPLYIVDKQDINQAIQKLASKNLYPLVFSFSTAPENLNPNIIWQTIAQDTISFAHALYSRLHFADTEMCDCIILEATPQSAEWLAINDRLGRASSLFNYE